MLFSTVCLVSSYLFKVGLLHSMRADLLTIWVCFLALPWVCLQFVIVVFPDHTHLLFLY